MSEDPLSRAERTPEVVAVSGICGESGESLKTLPDFPVTNFVVAPIAVVDGDADTPKKPTIGDFLPHYVHCEATSPSTLKTQAQKAVGQMCGSLALVGVTESGKRIAKRICCGREWCEECREQAHNRRIARILKRLLQICPMTYIVVTFPVEVRPLMRSKATLALLGKRLRGLLRKRGYQKVYTRWHFFGDTPGVYHPHLNVLCDGGGMSPKQLADEKDAIRHKLLPRSMAKLIDKDLVVHYAYSQDEKRMMHWTKYVTKATFLEREWDDQLASMLYGFHNGCFAGTWGDAPKWKLTGTDKKFNALARLGEGRHPESGEPVVWDKKPLPWALVLIDSPIHLGAWWYSLPPTRPPPVRRGGVEVRLNGLLKRKHAAFLASEEYLEQLTQGGD
ncbi:hypothetical protein ES708_19021 [subsurface metagenome]